MEKNRMGTLYLPIDSDTLKKAEDVFEKAGTNAVAVLGWVLRQFANSPEISKVSFDFSYDKIKSTVEANVDNVRCGVWMSDDFDEPDY